MIEKPYADRSSVGYEKLILDGGDIWYMLNGKLHREDGPAKISANGDLVWAINGKFHREGEPAVIHSNGYEAWLIHNDLHREDGPARLWVDGKKEYWLNNIQVKPENYHEFSPLQLAKLGLI